MKKLFLAFTALILGTAIKLQAQSDLIAQIHFLGGDKISTDKNSRAFLNEFASPDARALENQTLDKFSKFPGVWFKSKLPPHANDGAAQLRPLLGDLLKSEWIFEMRDANNGSPEYALAVHLNNERAELWSKTLQTVLKNWTDLGISAGKSDTWELRKHLPPNLFHFSRSGDWVILDCGENQLQLSDEILKTKTAVTETNWLSVDMNWPRLAQLFPSLSDFDFPKIAFQVIGRDGIFHFTGKLNLSQPLPSLEKWRLPTNAIHTPFVSFTAARGAGSWLQKQSWFQPFELQPQPDQFFVWALPQIPFQTFVAEPVPDAATALAQLDRHMSENESWLHHFMMPLTLRLTNNSLSFVGIPFAAPSIRAVREPDGDFLVGGFFPNTPRSKPIPPELFEQLNAPNLVYYHWEITSQRLKELPELSQLLLMLTEHRQLLGGSAAFDWLTNIAPTLGATVTRATEISPTELNFTRSAPGGFTAIEFLALANWLDSPKFPELDLLLPPRPKLRPHPNRKILSKPAPQPAKKR